MLLTLHEYLCLKRDCASFGRRTASALKIWTQQTATKADCDISSRLLRLDQNAAFEHTAKTSANGQLTHPVCSVAKWKEITTPRYY